MFLENSLKAKMCVLSCRLVFQSLQCTGAYSLFNLADSSSVKSNQEIMIFTDQKY